MSDSFEEELKAEIASFRAEVAEREERRERERQERERLFGADDDPLLDSDHVRDWVAQRYETARLRKRLEAAERRISELENRNG